MQIVTHSGQVRHDARVTSGLLFVHSPLFLCRFDLLHVVDASLLAGGGSGFDKVGDSDPRKHRDDKDNDHDLDQGERACFHSFCLRTLISKAEW